MNSEPNKLLITGGCGFIGTNLIKRLNDLGGYEIRVFDDESVGNRAALAALEASFVKGDIRDSLAVAGALEGIDAVVHLAAHTRVIESVENPAHNFDVNARGMVTLLEAMRHSGVKRMINASTGGAILGEVEPPVHEEILPRPVAPYGASKLAAEGYCMAYSGSYGMEALSLRFSNVYGPRSFHKGSAVAAFYKLILDDRPVTIYGDGSQIRDFIFVEDLCDGIIAGISSKVTGIIQLGSGRPTSIEMLLDAMAPIVSPKKIRRDYLPFRGGEIRNTYCDIAKARRMLGFEPSISLSAGLARTWSWFTETGFKATELKATAR